MVSLKEYYCDDCSKLPITPAACVEVASPPPVPVSPSHSSVVFPFIGAIGEKHILYF